MDGEPMAGPSPEVRRQVRKWIIQASLGLVAYGLILFLAAGTIRWFWGWVYMIVLALFMAGHPLLLRPELLAERQRGTRTKGVKGWDKWLTGLLGPILLAIWLVAGLDFRFGWTEALLGRPWSVAAYLLGLLLCGSGYALFLWAMTANDYFAEGVRIQRERSHSVATGGPYRYVRHPGYAGVLLSTLGQPLLLGSIWAAVPALMMMVLYIVRTALEDRTLRAELPGYQAFAHRTRWRLVPGVW